MRNFILIAAIHSLFCAAPPLLADVVMVKGGEFVAEYNGLAETLAAGQTVAMEVESGQWVRFKIARIIAGVGDRLGTQSVIIETTDGRVARIPKVHSPRRLSFMQKFMVGAEQTKEWHGKEVVAVDLRNSVTPFVAFTELLNLEFTLDQFSNAYNDYWQLHQKIPTEVEVAGTKVDVALAMKNLAQFFESLATLGRNEDFSAAQLGQVTGRGWVWFDLYENQAVDTIYGASLIPVGMNLPRLTKDEFIETIQKKRHKLGWKPGVCEVTQSYMDGFPVDLDFF